MTYVSLLCPPFSGHLNLMLALGRALQRGSHRVAAVNVLDDQAADVQNRPLITWRARAERSRETAHGPIQSIMIPVR